MLFLNGIKKNAVVYGQSVVDTVIGWIAIIGDNRLHLTSVRSRLSMASTISLGSSLISFGFSYFSILLQFLLSGISTWAVWAVRDTVAQQHLPSKPG